MNHLTRRAFIITASLLPQAAAAEMAAHKLPGLQAGKSHGPLSILPAVPESAAATPEGDQQPTAEQKVIDRFRHMPAFRKELGWKLAYTQHSMYMFIDEDRGVPIVGERTSPWGAPDASVYVGRIRRNLASLEKIPGLRLSYDFPGVDIESIARDFPDVVEQMQRMHKRGVFDFVNGTYSGAALAHFEFGEQLAAVRVWAGGFRKTVWQESEDVRFPGDWPQSTIATDSEAFRIRDDHPRRADFPGRWKSLMGRSRWNRLTTEQTFCARKSLSGRKPWTARKLPFYLVEPMQGFQRDWNIQASHRIRAGDSATGVAVLP